MNPNEAIKSTSDELNQMGNAITINSVMAGLIKTYSYVSLHPHTEEVDIIKKNTLNTIEDLVIPLVKSIIGDPQKELDDELDEIRNQINQEIKKNKHLSESKNLYYSVRIDRHRTGMSKEQQKIITLRREYYRIKFRKLNEFYAIIMKNE